MNKQNNLNQFQNYKSQLTSIHKSSNLYSTALSFNYILNNIFCTYSFHKGKTKWREIQLQIPEPYKFKINIEISHVELRHGIDQARLAVKSEMEKYIEYLIGNGLDSNQ